MGILTLLTGVVSTGSDIFLISSKTSFNETANVGLTDVVMKFSEGVW